jgi:catechol 2,3-dioxygenase-like lactoylglutathione lyase family enzyme
MGRLMLTHSRMVYLTLYASDLRASREFYEQILGFRPLEADDVSSKYDAGQVMLCLTRDDAYGLSAPSGRDRSADITMLVRDRDRVQAALERRGVKFSRVLDYEVGATGDFYDPDGHWFSIYQPSEEAMTWPSGEKIRVLTHTSTSESAVGLGALLYLFLFVRDREETFAFYHDALGLVNIEGGSCKQGATHEHDGVIKYDAGGALVTTHCLDDERLAAKVIDPGHMVGIAPVFQVDDLRAEMRALEVSGVRFADRPAVSAMGTVARFEDPCGHRYCLYEPSPAALKQPSGRRIRQILAAPLFSEPVALR